MIHIDCRLTHIHNASDHILCMEDQSHILTYINTYFSYIHTYKNTQYIDKERILTYTKPFKYMYYKENS